MTFKTLGPGRGETGESGERGQSEVIGTILMVAVVVIMAAGVGQFVFGLDIVTFDRPTVGPQASFGVTEVNESTMVIEHQSGDALDMEEITIDGGDGGDPDTDLGDEWTSGEELEITNLTSGDTVRVIWKSSETDDSNVIFEHEFEG